MADDVKHLLDFGAIGTAFGTLFDLLPHVSSLLAIIWIIIRIYESRTVQKMLFGVTPPLTRKDDQNDC